MDVGHYHGNAIRIELYQAAGCPVRCPRTIRFGLVRKNIPGRIQQVEVLVRIRGVRPAVDAEQMLGKWCCVDALLPTDGLVDLHELVGEHLRGLGEFLLFLGRFQLVPVHRNLVHR